MVSPPRAPNFAPAVARCKMAKVVKQLKIPTCITGRQINVHHKLQKFLVLDIRETSLADPSSAHLLKWSNWGAVFGTPPAKGSAPPPRDLLVLHLPDQSIGRVPNFRRRSETAFWLVEAESRATTLNHWYWAKVFTHYSTDVMTATPLDQLEYNCRGTPSL